MWLLVLRAVVSYLVLRLVVQLFGWRRVDQLSVWELLVAASLALFTGLATLGPEFGLLDTIAVLLLWLGLFALERYAITRNFTLRQATRGEPTVLVYQGKVLEHNLYRKRLTPEQLLSKLRARNVFRLMDVELAILEPDGELSVQKAPQAEPVTRQDVLVAGRRIGLPLELIVDGQIVHENLQKRNLSEKWLRDHLRAYGVEFVNEVALATVDENGDLYVDRYDGNLFRNAELHPALTRAQLQGKSERRVAEELLREQPVSQIEQKYLANQLNQAERAVEPVMPEKDQQRQP